MMTSHYRYSIVSHIYQHPAACTLLEVLAVGPLSAVDNEVPSHGGLEERLVVGVVEVNLLVLVRLPIRGDVHDGLVVEAAADDGTGDDRVVGLAQDTHRAEEVLPRGLETVEEAANLVGGHEDLGELVVVLEVDTPDREALLVEPDVSALILGSNSW